VTTTHTYNLELFTSTYSLYRQTLNVQESTKVTLLPVCFYCLVTLRQRLWFVSTILALYKFVCMYMYFSFKDSFTGSASVSLVLSTQLSGNLWDKWGLHEPPITHQQCRSSDPNQWPGLILSSFTTRPSWKSQCSLYANSPKPIRKLIKISGKYSVVNSSVCYVSR